MKKTELKKALKPLIKECIRESLLEEGLLSSVISEVVKGMRPPEPAIVEKKQDEKEMIKMQLQEKEKRSKKIQETRKKMLDAIGKSSYNGVDLFEGTTPMSSPSNPSSPAGPLSGVEPGDAGVDISSFTLNKNVWKALVKGK